MATLRTPAHINATLSHPPAFFAPSLSVNATASKVRSREQLPVRRGVKCALPIPTPKWRESRRLVSISLFLFHLLLQPNNAIAGGIFNKYVKRKKLDPLEAYVPAVILSEFQIKDLDKIFEVVDSPQFADCRSLLRSGPAASLRINIRARFGNFLRTLQVAQYASDAGNGKAASNDVDQCLRALEELNSLLLHASRSDPEASVKSMKTQIRVALNALERVQTVPPDVLYKGKAIADAYRTPEEDAGPQILDPELKNLESIL